jgi:hypothetical protein
MFITHVVLPSSSSSSSSSKARGSEARGNFLLNVGIASDDSLPYDADDDDDDDDDVYCSFLETNLVYL